MVCSKLQMHLRMLCMVNYWSKNVVNTYKFCDSCYISVTLHIVPTVQPLVLYLVHTLHRAVTLHLSY